MQRKSVIIYLSTLGISVIPCLSHAAGFALIEQNASGMGNAYAGGAAIAEDASTIFFNPAGLSRLKGTQVVVAGHIIKPTAKFSNAGSTTAAILGATPLSGPNADGGTLAIVPNVYLSYTDASNVVLGLGINVPFGLSTVYDDNWVGRYHGVKSDLVTKNLNPSIAYRWGEMFSLGFGVNIQTMEVTLSSAIDVGTLTGGAVPQDGFVTLHGDNSGNIGLGWNIGFLLEPSSETRIGLSYRSKVDHTLRGKADFSLPGQAVALLTSTGSFVDTDISAEVTMPEMASLSAYHEISENLALMADFTWTDWSVFEELRVTYASSHPSSVTTENWKETYRGAFGLTYAMDEHFSLKAGLAYDQSPVPDDQHRTPRVPDSDRTWISFGATYKPLENLSLDLGYSHLFVADSKINNTFESSVPTLASTLKGSYSNSVDILSLQLNWQF